MPLTTTPSCLLHQALVSQYMGKTILSDGGSPFTVGSVHWDRATFEVTLHERSYPSTCLSGRTIGMNDALPEIWPFEVPMSPCS